MCARIQFCGVETRQSSAMPGSRTFMCTDTDYILSCCEKLDKRATAWPSSTPSPPLFVPSSLRLTHLHPFSCPTLSPYTLLLHLSPQSAPEWPCCDGGWEADSPPTYWPEYHPLICPARPNSPHRVPADGEIAGCIHSEGSRHKQHTNTADNYITVTTISHRIQLLCPCDISVS